MAMKRSTEKPRSFSTQLLPSTKQRLEQYLERTREKQWVCVERSLTAYLNHIERRKEP